MSGKLIHQQGHITAAQGNGEESRQQIATLQVWINAFIPRDISGTTLTLDQGEHAGKTVFPASTPMVYGYLTDQRGFSTDPNAHSRMHSEIQVDIVNRRIIREIHRCDPTIEIASKNGQVSCNESADTSSMHFGTLQVSQEQHTLSIDLKASAKNACLKVANIPTSPNLDYSGTITIQPDDTRSRVLVWFKGMIRTLSSF